MSTILKAVSPVWSAFMRDGHRSDECAAKVLGRYTQVQNLSGISQPVLAKFKSAYAESAEKRQFGRSAAVYPRRFKDRFQPKAAA